MNPAPATMENQRSFLDRDLPTALQLPHSWEENMQERWRSHLPLPQVTLAAPPGHGQTRSSWMMGAFPGQGSAHGAFFPLPTAGQDRVKNPTCGQVSNGPTNQGNAVMKQQRVREFLFPRV